MGFVLTCWLLSGCLCAFIGSEKGRSGVAWFFAGCLFGVFAIVAVCAVPRLDSKA